MSTEGFETAGPAREGPQIHSLDRAATGSVDTIICKLIIDKNENIYIGFCWNGVGCPGGSFHGDRTTHSARWKGDRMHIEERCDF